MTARCSASPPTNTACVPERQLDWLRASALGFEVDVREITEEVAALAVQGPTSAGLLRAAGIAGVEVLKPFEHGEYFLAAGGAGG
ncbi:MAG TPA: hypothetical protein VEC10_13435, partial [Steroidobacteraceae bacterium]|nr:hypothetical protein [Steroidobacteraceae bacterium]